MRGPDGIADISALWVYLAASPLFWLTATVAAYLLAQRIAAGGGNHPLLNPVGLAAAMLIAVLVLSGTPYSRYFDGAQFVHFLLGPATVALSVPLFDNLAQVRRTLLPMAAALTAGCATAILSAAGIAKLLGAGPEMIATVAPKSVTTPIAMGVAEQLGGIPSLTAALVIATGVVGAVVAPPLVRLLGATDERAGGFAVGVGGGGIGTARAFQISELLGTFSGIGMAFNGLLTAVLTPLLLMLF